MLDVKMVKMKEEEVGSRAYDEPLERQTRRQLRIRSENERPPPRVRLSSRVVVHAALYGERVGGADFRPAWMHGAG